VEWTFLGICLSGKDFLGKGLQSINMKQLSFSSRFLHLHDTTTPHEQDGCYGRQRRRVGDVADLELSHSYAYQSKNSGLRYDLFY